MSIEPYNKLELQFYHEEGHYIAKQVDHRATDVALTDPCMLTWKVEESGIAYSSNSATVYNMKKKTKYEIVGVLKFLHDMKDSLVKSIVDKGGDVDRNWVIIRQSK